MIKINSLEKYFNRGKENEIHVLNNITMVLPERGMVAIFGRSGCGKTTLLNVIGGLDSYLSGSVEIDGEKITTDSDALRNRHIGYIFQNYNLSTGETCFDNVAAALRLCGMSDKKDGDVIHSRTMAALSAVGMAPYAGRYPDTLSGGQKQRIAIARAIVKSPDIILADEPTGNLDETNTVMIMDILREIAKTRLVLIVTHEGYLVDKYCDRVIGITDGKITSIRDNDIGSGYVSRNKNHVYLGEYEKTETSAGFVNIDYYGEPTAENIKITLVNDGGKIYLRVDTPGVHVVDEYGETKLHEGTFEKKREEGTASKLDMSLLESFEGKKYGSLFTFFSSLRSGSKILRGKKIRKDKKIAKASNLFAASYLVIFALIFTLLLSYCASGIAVYDNIEDTINLNMFYINIGDIDESKLTEAVHAEEACVDFLYSSRFYSTSGQYLQIETGVFETFQYGYTDSYSTSLPLLPHYLIKDCEVIEGNLDGLGKNDVVLSREAADAFLATGSYDYISDYSDLINCNLENSYYGGEGDMKIAAIVESGELAAYYHEITLAYTLSQSNRLSIIAASDYGIDLAPGEAMVGATVNASYLPKKGETIKVNGIELKVTEAANNVFGHSDYGNWLHEQNITPKENGGYYENLESYYSYLPEYAMYCLLTGYEEAWLTAYFIDGFEDALYIASGNHEYLGACKYREEHGEFPTYLSKEELAEYEDLFYALRDQCYTFQQNHYFYNSARYNPTSVYLSDEDYSNALLGFGETHPVAQADYYYSIDGKYNYGSSSNFVILHSFDPEATEAYLRECFPELPPNDPDVNFSDFITPELLIETELEYNRTEIISSIVALGVGLLLMCVCIYFIMRSSMLSKVREIGIWRAVGVSKKNMIFKFAVESTAIALQTLAIGFAIGAYLTNSLASGGVTATTFYFPFWLGALTLAFLVTTCILFGIIPIASLLRKTPAQILAKYDI